MAEDKGGCYTLDMRKFMSLMAEGKRWKDLQDNSTYAIKKVSSSVRPMYANQIQPPGIWRWRVLWPTTTM
jgi:hypothetical protein